MAENQINYKVKPFMNDPENAVFSVYSMPIMNLVSKGEMSLKDIYIYIKGDKAAMENTQRLREIKNEKEHRKFKSKHFDYALFSGVFNARNDAGLATHSGLLCIDLDHLGYLRASIRERLLLDKYFKTWLLFTSPSGDGLKWVIAIDLSKGSHEMWFHAIQNYMRIAYRLDIDSQCINVSRACFLPYDPYVYAAPEIIAQIGK